MNEMYYLKYSNNYKYIGCYFRNNIFLLKTATIILNMQI